MTAYVQNVEPTQTLWDYVELSTGLFVLWSKLSVLFERNVSSSAAAISKPPSNSFFTVPNGVKIVNWINLTCFGLRFHRWSQVTPLVLSDEQPDIAAKSEDKIEDHSEDWFG